MNIERWDIPKDHGSILRRVMRRIDGIDDLSGRRRLLRRAITAALVAVAIGSLAAAIAFGSVGCRDGDGAARATGQTSRDGQAASNAGDAADISAGAGAGAEGSGVAADFAGDASVAAAGGIGGGTSLGPPPAADDDSSSSGGSAGGGGDAPRPAPTNTPPTEEPCPFVCVVVWPTAAVPTPTLAAGCPPSCEPVATPTVQLCKPVCVEANPTAVPTIAAPTATTSELCPPVCP